MTIHHPLCRENREFRLARFCPAQDESEDDRGSRISLELRPLSMNDKPPYIALSYVWGSSTRMTNIEVNGEPFPVGPNLCAALKQLGRDQGSSWIWVDSICIDQANVEEKSWQVNEMSQIYSSAEQVYMWLGRAADGSDEVMDLISRVDPRMLQLGPLPRDENTKSRITDCIAKRSASSETGKDLHRDIVDSGDGNRVDGEMGDKDSVARIGDFLLEVKRNMGLYGRDDPIILKIEQLLQREYWKRIWMVQEVALTRVATIVCGRKMVALELFDAAFSAVWHALTLTSLKLRKHPFAWTYTCLYEPIRCISVRRQRRLGKSVLLGDILLDRNRPLQQSQYVATDPRDIVFGILGVISDSAELNVCANYNKSTAEVYVSVTRSLIRSGDQDPKFLTYYLGQCNPSNSSPDLPSWALNFRKLGWSEVECWPFSDLGTFKASKGSLQPPYGANNDLDDFSILRLRGCLVDVVTEVMEPTGWYKSLHKSAKISKDVTVELRSLARLINRVAALIWGMETPVILRGRDDGGFEYLGDAYVPGIMYGEYMKTQPPEGDFELH
ncbi:heterokaryon incompatibility protein-domain-containing protein [Hypoxylon sp. FL1284]|nr:heterokaryon incompatibility protein-domain-containing protein [Hypoxylon sp. FL1284]